MNRIKISNHEEEISRRAFLKRLGAGTAAVSGLTLAGCRPTTETSAQSEPPTDRMTYRENPTTGDRVSLLGFGMMRLPSVGGRSAREGNEQIDQEMVNAMVDYALAHGVNYFDTSPAYCQGLSERATGIALSRHPRDSYFIATKLSNFAPSTWSREASIAMYRNSFKELQVDHIDYMLLHAIGMGGGMEAFETRYIRNGMLDFLIQEREAGRVRNLGWSFHGRKENFDEILAMHEKVHWDFVQIQMNYSDWRNARGNNVNAEYLYAELEKRSIPIVIMEPLLGGRLSNVPDHIAARLKTARPDSSVASWAFRFAGSKDMILTVLSGMTYMEHLQDNIRTYSPLEPLTEEETEFLYETAELMLQYPTIPCNDCQYCMPCPYGLDIPGILLHYNKCVNEGNLPASSGDENYRKARRAYLVGYLRSVEKERQADRCTGSKKCNPH